MMKKNLIYAQSGGATTVINVTAQGLIAAAQQYPDKIGKIYASDRGITGVLEESLFDVSSSTPAELNSITNVPGAFFGTCRYQLQDPQKDEREFQRIYELFKAHNIGYFFYNGGNDSQDTSHKIAQWCQAKGLDLCCLGIPKTIDNDLPYTDTCPGFGSVAKFLAVSLAEISADLRSICSSSTKVFILETMGRDSGWIAGATSLIKQKSADPPHLILLPEHPLEPKHFLATVDKWVKNIGYCVIVVSEGLRRENGDYFSVSSVLMDDFGHRQLGGTAPVLASMIKEHLGYKYHWAVPDYMQRAAKHLVSQVDYDQALAVGEQGVHYAMEGRKSIMIAIKRVSSFPYKWDIDTVPLKKVANQLKNVPTDFFNPVDYSMTAAARSYYLPLIQGEVYPQYEQGLTRPASLIKRPITAKLEPFSCS